MNESESHRQDGPVQPDNSKRGKTGPATSEGADPKKTKIKKVKRRKNKSHLKLLPPALDFGTSGIKLLSLSQISTNRYEVTAIDKADCGSPSQAASHQEWTEAIERLVKRNDVGKRVVSNIPVRDTVAYHLSFPKMAPSELDEAINWKVGQLKPFDLPPEQIEYKYSLLREEAGDRNSGAKQRVLVVCVAKEKILERRRLLSQLGLKSAGIEIMPMSVSNLNMLSQKQPGKKEIVLWIDLGAHQSMLTIEKGGQVQFFRALATNSRQFTRQIEIRCGVDEKKAEMLKRHYGLEGWTSENDQEMSLMASTAELDVKERPAEAVLYSLMSPLDNLVMDIEHSFKYFMHQVHQSQVSRYQRVVITGNGANMIKLDVFLASRLGVPVRHVNPFSQVEWSEEVREQSGGMQKSATDFCSALSMALASDIKPADRISFGQDEDLTMGKRVAKLAKKYPWLIAVFVAGVIAALVIPPRMMVSRYEERAAALAKEVIEARRHIKSAQSTQLANTDGEAELQKQNDILAQRLKILEAAEGDSGRFFRALRDLAASMPEGIGITKLSYMNDQLLVNGYAQESSEVVDFMEQMKASETFTDALFNYARKEDGRASYSFEVVATIYQGGLKGGS